MIGLAVKQAGYSPVDRTKHGAVIAKGKRVLGLGFNQYKTHTKYGGGYWGWLHAEAAAIRDAVRKGVNLAGSSIYVTRLGDSRMSKPCPACQAMIEAYGIRKVYYTDTDGVVITEYPLYA